MNGQWRQNWRSLALLQGPAPLIGTALALLLLGAALSDPAAKASDWLLYLVPVTLLPAAWAVGSRRWLPRRWRRSLQVGAAVLTLVTVLLLALRVPWPLLVVIGLHWWLFAFRKNVADAGAARWPARLGEALLIAAGWALALRIAWWDRAGDWLTADVWQLPLLISITFVLHWALLSRQVGARSVRLLDLAVALLLLGFALRTDMIVGDALGPLLEPSVLHHWSAIAGPAMLIRAGGLPLWDIPLQYGLLSAVTIAWLPFDVWTNLYLLQALLQTATAWLIYRVLRSGGGLPAAFAAALLAVTAVFLASGYREPLSGNYAWPSMGALRYFWIYALLIVLFVLQRRPLLQRRLQLLGDGLWLIGSLWSLESAIACSAVWLPAALLGIEPDRPGARAWLSAASRRLLRPLLGLAGLLAAVSLWYQLRYGLWPDWPRYADYLLAFGTRFSPTPVELTQRDGSVLPALAVGVTAAAYGALRLQRGDRPTAALLFASATALWAISSYALQRGLELLFGTIALPALLLTIGLLLSLQRRGHLGRSGRLWVSALMVPCAAVLSAANLSHPQAADALQQALRPQQQAPIAQMLPPVDPELSALLTRADVRPHEPLAVTSIEFSSLPAAYDNQPGWLPTLPQLMYLPLTAEQAARYLERAAARAPGGGWLLEPSSGSLWPESWLSDRLTRTHLAGRSYRSEHWQLTWYERRAQPPTELPQAWQLSRQDAAVWRYLSGDPADPADWRELTTALRDIYGRPGVDGWSDGPSEPLIGFERGQSAVLAHPGPQRALIVVWRSPLAGRVALSGSLRDVDDSCGDGVSRQLRLPDGRQSAGQIVNGGEDRLNDGLPLMIAVVPGSEVIFVLESAGEYSCDSTAVELRIELLPAASQP